MKEIKEEFAKFKKDQNLEKELKNAFLAAKKDEVFANIIKKLPIKEKELYQYTSILEECSQENQSCFNCQGLVNCTNKINGHAYTPILIDEKLEFAYQACRYQKEKMQDQAYLKNVLYLQISDDLQLAQMKNIYKKDESRYVIISWLTEFIKKYPNCQKGVYLHGNFGSGKTYLITAMFNELAKKKYQSAIIYWPEFLNKLKASFNGGFSDYFEMVKKRPLLLIDDIGAENVTEWGRDEILGTILQYRMQANLPTFFTSNFDLEGLEEHFSYAKDKVSRVKARRIIERIKYLTEEQKLVGKNFRN